MKLRPPEQQQRQQRPQAKMQAVTPHFLSIFYPETSVKNLFATDAYTAGVKSDRCAVTSERSQGCRLSTPARAPHYCENRAVYSCTPISNVYVNSVGR